MSKPSPVNLKAFIKPNRIILGLTATERSEVFAKLIEPLVAEEIVTDAEAFLADLERRESEFTTMTENGIAIPHARSHAVRRLGVSVGIAAGDGIPFNPDSDDMCKLLFLYRGTFFRAHFTYAATASSGKVRPRTAASGKNPRKQDTGRRSPLPGLLQGLTTPRCA
jgi:hypothetical protein